MATDVQTTIPLPPSAGSAMSSSVSARHKSKNRVVTNKDRKRSEYYDDVFEPATTPPAPRQQPSRPGRQDNGRSDRSSRPRTAVVSESGFEAVVTTSTVASPTPQLRRSAKVVRHSTRSEQRAGQGLQGFHPHMAAMGWRGSPSDPRQGHGGVQQHRVPSSPRLPPGHPLQHPRASGRTQSRGASAPRPREQSVHELAFSPSPALTRAPAMTVPGVQAQVQYSRQVSLGRYGPGLTGGVPSPMDGAPSTPAYFLYPSQAAASCENAGSPMVAPAPQYASCVQTPVGHQPQGGVAPGNGYAQQVSYCCSCSMCVTAQQQQQQQPSPQCPQVFVYGAQPGPGQMVSNQPAMVPSTPVYYQTGTPSIPYSASAAAPPTVPQAASTTPVVSQQAPDGMQYKTSTVYTVPVHAAPQCCTAEVSGTHPTPTVTPTPEAQHAQVQRPPGSGHSSPAPQSAGVYGYPHPSAARCSYVADNPQVQSPSVYYYASPQTEVPQAAYPVAQQVSTPSEQVPKSYSSPELPTNLNLSTLPPGFYKIVQNGVVQSYVQVGGTPSTDQVPVAGGQPPQGYYSAQAPVPQEEATQRHGAVPQPGHVQAAVPHEQALQGQDHQQGSIEQQQQQMYASPQPVDPRRGTPYQAEAPKQQAPAYMQGPSPNPAQSPYPGVYPAQNTGGCLYADHPDPNVHLKPGLLSWNPQVYESQTRFVYPANPYQGVPQMRMVAPYPVTAGCYPGGHRPMTATRAREYGEYTYDSDGDEDGNSTSSECSTCDSDLDEVSVDEQTEALGSLMDKYIESIYEDAPSDDGDKSSQDEAQGAEGGERADDDIHSGLENAETSDHKADDEEGKGDVAVREGTDGDSGREEEGESVVPSPGKEERKESVSSSNSSEGHVSADETARKHSENIDIVAATAALKMLLNIPDEREAVAVEKMAMSIRVEKGVSCCDLESGVQTVTIQAYASTSEVQASPVAGLSDFRDNVSLVGEVPSTDGQSKTPKSSDSTSRKSRSSVGAEDGDIESGDEGDASGDWCTEEEVEEMDEESKLYEEEVFARYSSVTKTKALKKLEGKATESTRRTEVEKDDDVFEDANESDGPLRRVAASHEESRKAGRAGSQHGSSSDRGQTPSEQRKNCDEKKGDEQNTEPAVKGNGDDGANTSMELVPYTRPAGDGHSSRSRRQGGKGSRYLKSQVIYHVSSNGQIFPGSPSGQPGSVQLPGAGCMPAFPGGHGTLSYVVQSGGQGSRAVLQPVYNIVGVHGAGDGAVTINGFGHPPGRGSAKAQELHGEDNLESSAYVPHGQFQYVCSSCHGDKCCDATPASEAVGAISVPSVESCRGHKGRDCKFLITGQKWDADLVHYCPEDSSCGGDCKNWGNAVYVDDDGQGGYAGQGNTPATPSRGDLEAASFRGYTPEREWFRTVSEECGEDTEVLVEPAAHTVVSGSFGDSNVFPGRNFRWGNYPRPPLIPDYEVILPPAGPFPDKRRSSSRTSSTGSSGKDGPKRRKSRSKAPRPDECNIS